MLVGWQVTEEVNFIEIGNGFRLVMFLTTLITRGCLKPALVCWWANLQPPALKQDFEPVKEKLLSILLWVHVPRLLLEIWTEAVPEKILKLVAKIYKIDTNSEILSKEVDWCEAHPKRQ